VKKFHLLSGAVVVTVLIAAAQIARGDQLPLKVQPNVTGCVVVWSGGGAEQSLQIGIPGPCDLHKTLGGDVRVHKDKNRSIVLIEHSVPDPTRGGKTCITEIRALAIEAGQATVSRSTSRVASCPPFQWDQVVFTGLF
jgi:hypothetical protein